LDYPGKLSVLCLPAAEMPVCCSPGQRRLQPALVADLEQLRFEHLQDQLRLLPGTDRRRQLFFNLGRESALFVTTFMRAFARCSQDVWVEIVARYLGLPSPACAAIVGRPVPAPRNRAAPVVADRFGDALAASTCFSEDHVRKLQHDPVVALLVRFAKAYAGTAAVHEDAATLASVLRQHPSLLRPGSAADRNRAAAFDALMLLPTPDGGAAVDHIIEFKTVHFGPTHYGRALEQCAAVERRVRVLPSERRAGIAKMDQEIFGTPSGQVGPLEQRFNSFPMIGIATGAFGEWSQSLVDLIKTFASMGAEAWQARLGAPTVAASRSTLLWLMRAELGMCVVRGHAQLVLRRARMLAAQLPRGGRAHAAAEGSPRTPPGWAEDAHGVRAAAQACAWGGGSPHPDLCAMRGG